ncbi:MAG: PAS domain S-box protein [bacterium]
MEDPHPIVPPSEDAASNGPLGPEAEEILQLLLEHSTDAIYILQEGKFPVINRKFQELFKVGPEEVDAPDFSFLDLVAPSSLPLIRERARRIETGEEVPGRYEFTAVTSEGEEVHVEASTTRIDYLGAPATLGIVRDITVRKEAEQRLRQSDERLRAVITSIPLVLWAVDTEGVFTLSEGQGLEILGLEPGEVVGRSAYEVYGDHPIIESSIRKALGGESRIFTVEIGGTLFETYVSPLKSEAGGIIGAIGVSADISENAKLEAQLRQAQKMEAIGRLAGGIAHDFNNILTVISGNVELSLLAARGDRRLEERLQTVQKASRHAQELTSRLLAFSRKQVSEPQVLDLNRVLHGLGSLLARLIGEDIRLETRFEPDLPPIHMDPSQIEQILVNLVVNSRDAMPRGGELSIETRSLELGEEYHRTHPYVEPGRYVELAVRDTGTGMSEEIKSQIFEPFFTTKGGGSGLGLSTVYGIVKQSGSSIEVESEVGEGTTFRILVPVTDLEDSPPAGRPDRTDRLPLGRETVVVVEDEEAVRELTAEILSDLGYRVHDFQGSDEARAFFDSLESPPDLLLTDVVMPGTSGPDLARGLKEGLPGLKVLYMSGYTDDAIARHGVLEEGVDLLTKPFTSGQLAWKVREVLDRA